MRSRLGRRWSEKLSEQRQPAALPAAAAKELLTYLYKSTRLPGAETVTGLTHRT